MAGLLIRKFADKSIPDDFLERAVKQFGKGMGAVMLKPTKNGIEMQRATNAEVDIETLQEAQKQFGKHPWVLHLEGGENPIPDDARQPFVLIGKNPKSPELVAFLEGSFQPYNNPKSTYPDEHFAVVDYLLPKIEELYQECGQDLDKLVDRLRKPLFEKEMQRQWVARGNIVFVSSNEHIVDFHQNSDRAEFPWGVVSRNLGFKAEVKPEPAKAEAPKRKSLFGGADEIKAEVEKIAHEEPKKQESKPATSVPSTGFPDEVMLAPPKGLSRSARKKWYRRVCKYLPQEWDDGVEVKVESKRLNDNDKARYLAEANGTTETAVTPPPEKRTAEQMRKDIAPKHIGRKDEVVLEHRRPATPLPLIPQEERARIVDQILPKYRLDTSSKEVSDPRKAQEMENKLPNFAKQCGLDSLADTLNWSQDALSELIESTPKGALVLMMNYRSIARAALLHGTNESEEKIAPATDIPGEERTPIIEKEAEKVPDKEVSERPRRRLAL